VGYDVQLFGYKFGYYRYMLNLRKYLYIIVNKSNNIYYEANQRTVS